MSFYRNLGLESLIIDREISYTPIDIFGHELVDKPHLYGEGVLTAKRDSIEGPEDGIIWGIKVILTGAKLLGPGSINNNDSLLSLIDLELGILADVSLWVTIRKHANLPIPPNKVKD